jgi:hypothetical protein
MVFELQNGAYYQYDAATRSWIKIASGNLLPTLATELTDGAMSAESLRKLNRLLLPPPTSTLTGNDCQAPFTGGTIALHSGDHYINVEGSVPVQNLDSTATQISQSTPFQIHQHTYGFDFTLDLTALTAELTRRNQLRAVGIVGLKGATGDQGLPGENYVPAGPEGEQGEQGAAPQSPLSVQTETVDAVPLRDLERAITAVRVLPDATDSDKGIVQLDRQVIGRTDACASLFNVRQQRSTWVLCVASVAADCQDIYYIDADPLVESVRTKYLEEVQRLKQGYEDIVQFWVQTMSDLFDEQKAALCCALEFCQSKTKSEHLRRHMESTAAAALPDARITTNERASGEATEVSSTALYPTIGQTDLCGASSAIEAEAKAARQVEPVDLHLDPLLHISPNNAATTTLPAGQFVATIEMFGAQINGMHYADIAIEHNDEDHRRTTRFLNKGRYSGLMAAKSAYEGLTVAFSHDGGNVGVYLRMVPTPNASGSIKIHIAQAAEPEPPEELEPGPPPQRMLQVNIREGVSCVMDAAKLAWYERAWRAGNCCGVVVNIAGQDFIIIKKSIGDDPSCGGGESKSTPCLAELQELGHPAFAWPTFDGENFAPVTMNSIVFHYDENLNEHVQQLVAEQRYDGLRGKSGARHVEHQFELTLFPVA